YSIDQRHVRIMPYEPRHPYHLRYQTEWQAPKKILQEVERGVLTLNQYLGYDLNTVEFAIRDGVPLAIDFCNPAPDAEAANVGQANFEWVVEAVSEMAIRKAREHLAGRDNLSWGKFMQAAVDKRELREWMWVERAHVPGLRAKFAELAGAGGLKIASVGRHPFSHRQDKLITEGERTRK